jgi:hypothetical protein
MSVEYNNKWGDIPNTYKHAVPIEFDTVKGKSVIWLERGYLRGSYLNDQYLELSEVDPVFTKYKHKQRVEVKLLWFGRKPQVTWANVTILGDYKIIKLHSGLVLRNFGRKGDSAAAAVMA